MAATLRNLYRRLLGLPYLLLTLTTLFWGGNAVASRIAIGQVSPMSLTLLRWSVSCSLLALVARDHVRADWPVLRRHMPYLAGLAFVGLTAFNALMYIAAHSTTAVNITILQGAIPVFVLLGALAAFGTPIRPAQIVGVLVTIAGVAIIAAKGDLAAFRSLAFAPGDLLMLVACACYAVYTVALSRRPDVSGLGFFAVLAGIALVLSVPLFAVEVYLGESFWPTPTGYAVIAY
eukprot:gene23797-25367_t